MPDNPQPKTIRVDNPYTDYDSVPLNETPIVIDWKGKIGYGDIISPICYAHNLAEKNATDVVLNFHWKQKNREETRFKEQDPETIIDWAEYIANNTLKPVFWDVKVNHIFDSQLPFNHTNYDDKKGHKLAFSLHNMRYSRFGVHDYDNASDNYKELVFVTTTKHAQSIIEYDPKKAWKDPLGNTPGGHAWPRVADICAKRGWRIMHVHYETPIQEVVKKMMKARCVIGYHGAHMWLARWLGKPMILFAKGNLPQRAFPWAIKHEYWTDFVPDNIEETIQQSVKKREEIENELRYYLTNSNFHRLRSERT